MCSKTLLAIDEETAGVADYMKAQFPLMQSSGLPGAGVSHPTHWTLDFAIEVDHALSVIFCAVQKQGAESELVVPNVCDWKLALLVSTAWDVQRYADHIGLKNTGTGREELEEALLRMFKPVENAPSLEVMPCTITDRHGRYLLWYLPNILKPERQVSGPECNALRC